MEGEVFGWLCMLIGVSFGIYRGFKAGYKKYTEDDSQSENSEGGVVDGE